MCRLEVSANYHHRRCTSIAVYISHFFIKNEANTVPQVLTILDEPNRVFYSTHTQSIHKEEGSLAMEIVFRKKMKRNKNEHYDGICY